MAPIRSFAIRRAPPRMHRTFRLSGWVLLLLCLGVGGGACALRGRGGSKPVNADRVAAHAAREAGPASQRSARARWMEQSRELETTRKRLAGRTGARDEARKALDLAIGDELAPAWVGTKWTFSGRATRPYGGTVACGHYIGAVLRGAGLQVSSEVGALASARIVRTFAGKSRTRWRTDQGVQRVVEEVRREGTGLYLLGLDTHVGMLRVRGRAVDLCHSTGSWPRAVVCEDALASPSMRSRVHVWGPLLTDETVDAWLAGRRIPLAP